MQTHLLWLPLDNHFVDIVFLADFDKMKHLAIYGGSGVKPDHVAHFVDLHA